MRLLCVDDDADARMILALALALDSDLEVALEPSGERCLARAGAEPFDAILLDATMPAMDGFETCRRLKADPVTAEVPVVMLAAQDDATVAEAIAAGAVGCLTKPFDPMTLARDLRDALR